MNWTAELQSVCARKEQFPAVGKPEIVLVGRSNVGKSTLINALGCNKKLARTSSVPGKTQMVFFFDINNSFFLVDLPGYGFAKAAKSQKQKFSKVAEDYFAGERPIALALVLIDIRRGLCDLDLQMLTYLDASEIPWIFVLTKSDKLSENQRRQAVAELQKNWQTYYGEDFANYADRGYVFAEFLTAAQNSFKDPGVKALKRFISDVCTDARLIYGGRNFYLAKN